MKSGTRYRRRPISEINVVPYIDVMLVLLIIFMITAPLLTQGINVDLPEVATEPLVVETGEPLIVSVDRSGRYYLNIGERPDAPVEPQTLALRTAALLRQRPGARVLVKGDEGASYGQVVTAMAILQQAGAGNLGLVTNTPTSVDTGR